MRPPDPALIEADPHGLVAAADRLEDWLTTSALPAWWTIGADVTRGGFHDAIGPDGQAVAGPRRVRVQTRQAHVYATAARLGFAGPWRGASDHALDYIAGRYRRADGLYRARVGADGAPVDDAAPLYEQAFVLLALSTAYRLAPDRPEPRTEAEALLGRIRAAMAHPPGGFRETGPHPFQANAQMHLFEAAMAWSELVDDRRWRELADELAQLALARFIDPDGGFLREFFAADWSPAAGDDGRLVEPGHQFEWAWLLERWGRARGSTIAHLAAVRLFACGLKGVDPQRGVVVDELDQDLSVRSARARLWPQTEYVRAALILAETAAPAEAATYLRCAAQGAAALWRYLQTPVAGLWLDKLGADDRFETEASPATSFYHILGAAIALIDYRDRRGGVTRPRAFQGQVGYLAR